ncbi:MAG: flagellar basal body P-ring formation chaperone FlgA [Undibacterium sp.]|uniref:flagellar basal body P-ring formation chaperone FlgA n=1 Tax=Undibacterium sp. TaxID=1914977 RepID=UPI0027199290|nr:flagellar basal body P-ring formation chaperone FlgA [Undibacterium sp.]MDO8653697.1 flagellar basal body P-ring formation chaperone FlgA [Undibacterium sp.]
MKKIITLFLLGISQLALAQADIQIQDPIELRRVAEDFLRLQTTGHLGKVDITTGQIDSRLKLPACLNLSAFLPQGSKTWGKMTLGIRCTAPKPWTIYLSAQVKVSGDYYVAATPLLQGQIITANDISKVSGDLSTLPVGVITNPAQIIGRSLATSLTSGSVLRMEALKASLAVQQGQSVRVTSTGTGFQVTTDGLALNNANEGQIAKAKTLSGQVVSGIARIGGIIEINY